MTAAITTRLLILQCAATKKRTPGLLPAVERYNGSLWQTLRVNAVPGRCAVMALSAKHGLIDGRRPIEVYEQLLTDARAAELIEAGITPHLGEVEAARAGAGCEAFDEVCIVGGHRYVRVGVHLVAQLQEAGWVSPDARIVAINDMIGRMRNRLSRWMRGVA